MNLPVTEVRLNKKRKNYLHIVHILSLVAGSAAFALFSIISIGSLKFVLILTWIIAGTYSFKAIIEEFRMKRNGYTGLVVSRQGIENTTANNSLGIIHWEDVHSIKIENDVHRPGEKLIVLDLISPQKYLDREKFEFRKKTLNRNYHYYGSPVCISNKYLDCSFTDLYNLITDYFDYQEYRMAPQPVGESDYDENDIVSNAAKRPQLFVYYARTSLRN